MKWINSCCSKLVSSCCEVLPGRPGYTMICDDIWYCASRVQVFAAAGLMVQNAIPHVLLVFIEMPTYHNVIQITIDFHHFLQNWVADSLPWRIAFSAGAEEWWGAGSWELCSSCPPSLHDAPRTGARHPAVAHVAHVVATPRRPTLCHLWCVLMRCHVVHPLLCGLKCFENTEMIEMRIKLCGLNRLDSFDSFDSFDSLS